MLPRHLNFASFQDFLKQNTHAHFLLHVELEETVCHDGQVLNKETESKLGPYEIYKKPCKHIYDLLYFKPYNLTESRSNIHFLYIYQRALYEYMFGTMFFSCVQEKS